VDPRKIKKQQVAQLKAKKNGFIKSLEKDYSTMLQTVNKENADKFSDVRSLEKELN
jgi:hypothetical protein